MKRWIIILCCVAVAVAVAVWQSRGRSATSSLNSDPVSQPKAALGVEELMKGVAAYRESTILVEGVVSVASSGDHLFVLIDTVDGAIPARRCAALPLKSRATVTAETCLPEPNQVLTMENFFIYYNN